MGDKKTLAILLHKVSLANDDVILDFFTADFGRISIFAKKFSKSKKRNEIDFFRVIELGFFQGRNSRSLKTALTINVFHNFSRDFQSIEMGFFWLGLIREIMPEEEINNSLFVLILDFFVGFAAIEKEKWNAFFQVKMFYLAGFWPKLDKIRSAIYLDPITKIISGHSFLSNEDQAIKKNNTGKENPFMAKNLQLIYISNLERQVLEFLRRASLDEFQEKKDNLPDDFSRILEIIAAGDFLNKT